MVPLAPSSYSRPLPPFGIPPSIVPPPIVDTHYSSMIPTENVASNEAPMSSGFQYTGSVCNERKPLGVGNTSVFQVDEESVVPVNSSAYTVTTLTISAPSNAQLPFGHHNPQSTLSSQNQTQGYERFNNMWDNYQPNSQYRNYPQVPTEPSNNISLTPIEVVSDILNANQHEQDINTIDVTKYLPLDEKLDAIQSKVSTPFPSDCNQPGEVLVTTALSSETDGSQLTNSSHLNAHLPIPSNIRLLSNDSMNVQNMGLPQSAFELKEIDWNNSTVECESLEHHPISTPKPNKVPITDTSVIATSTPKLLS